MGELLAGTSCCEIRVLDNRMTPDKLMFAEEINLTHKLSVTEIVPLCVCVFCIALNGWSLRGDGGRGMSLHNFSQPLLKTFIFSYSTCY